MLKIEYTKEALEYVLPCCHEGDNWKTEGTAC